MSVVFHGKYLFLAFLISFSTARAAPAKSDSRHLLPVSGLMLKDSGPKWSVANITRSPAMERTEIHQSQLGTRIVIAKFEEAKRVCQNEFFSLKRQGYKPQRVAGLSKNIFSCVYSTSVDGQTIRMAVIDTSRPLGKKREFKVSALLIQSTKKGFNENHSDDSFKSWVATASPAAFARIKP